MHLAYIRIRLGLVLSLVLLMFISAGCDHGAEGDRGLPADAGLQRCLEPAHCPGIDRTVRPTISCITPEETPKGKAFTLHIYGQYLQDTGDVDTKISFDGNVTNGKPVSPCHLTVEVPSGYFSSAGQINVFAITEASSQPAVLTVE